MELEIFIILALIIVFLASCCGLIQKIRENYEEDRGQVISVTQIHVPNQLYNNNAYQTGGDELSSGVFPATFAPPPYTEHIEPPPRYEDLVKEDQFTVIQMEQNRGETPQALYLNIREGGTQNTEQPASARPNVH